MAKTAKKAVEELESQATVEVPEKGDAPVVDAEKEAMRNELAELRAQMELMAKMMVGGAGANPEVNKPKKFIPFYNMTATTLVLKGATVHKFRQQFEVQKIPESEAKMIVHNMPSATRKGMFYIADADFVRENELDAVYETILNVEQMKNLLNQDSAYVIEVYKNASDGQKQIIIDMVSDKKMNGQHVDANVLIELGKLCGKNLMNIESPE